MKSISITNSAEESKFSKKSLGLLSDEPIDLNLDLANDLSPYSAIRAFIKEVIGVDEAYQHRAGRELAKLDKVLKREASDYGFGASSSDGSSVAFAVLRRVSRESVYTARYIDSCATLTSEFLTGMADQKRIILRGLSGVDRLSLKTFIRAVAKLPKSAISAVTISEEGAEVETSESRSRQKISGRLSQALLGRDLQLGLRRKDMLDGSDVIEIAQNIVLQNFDRRIDNGDHDPEVFRLQAIAEVNMGQYPQAMALLEQAKTRSHQPIYTAHLDYLSGLISTKRHYNLQVSNSYFDRGIARLSDHADMEGAVLEYAWLLNGKALNAALEYRKSNAPGAWNSARELAFTAFGLIEKKLGRAYDYLRFNLLANIALLFEMKGEFDVALEIFEQTFGSSQTEDMKDESVGAHFCYRVAILKSKLNQYDDADYWLSTALEKAKEFECPFSQERIARAQLVLAEYERQTNGRGSNCDEILSRGCYLAEQNFAADGIAFYNSFHAYAETAAIDDPRGLFRLISPKMPAYIPEVDFEDIPKVDLNRKLSSANYASSKN